MVQTFLLEIKVMDLLQWMAAAVVVALVQTLVLVFSPLLLSMVSNGCFPVHDHVYDSIASEKKC